MEEIHEIVQTLEAVEELLDDLVVRGLRTADAAILNRLRNVHAEFQRIGALHLAERMETLVHLIEADDRGAAAALLRTQTSLRLFERVMTREFAQFALKDHLAGAETDDEDE